MTIDYALLDELGLGSVPEAEKKLMLADILENLTEKVGARAGAMLDETKRAEMDKVMQENPGSIGVWLEDNLPQYSQIVDEELAKIKDEIRLQVPGILADLQSSPPPAS